MTLSLKREDKLTVVNAAHAAAAGYAEFTSTTAKYPTTLSTVAVTAGVLYVALGIGNEVGELAELFDEEAVKPDYRHERYAKAWKELGDVQWYVARMCEEQAGLPPFAIMVRNAATRLADAHYREARISGFDLQSALCTHAGIVQGVVKKAMRDGMQWDEAKAAAKLEEMRVALQQMVNVSYEFAERTAPLVECGTGGYVALLKGNRDKLADRKERGVLHGDGGER